MTVYEHLQSNYEVLWSFEHEVLQLFVNIHVQTMKYCNSLWIFMFKPWSIAIVYEYPCSGHEILR